jgi:hypothetical protein
MRIRLYLLFICLSSTLLGNSLKLHIQAGTLRGVISWFPRRTPDITNQVLKVSPKLLQAFTTFVLLVRRAAYRQAIVAVQYIWNCIDIEK